jgi:hypothetical protein
MRTQVVSFYALLALCLFAPAVIGAEVKADEGSAAAAKGQTSAAPITRAELEALVERLDALEKSLRSLIEAVQASEQPSVAAKAKLVPVKPATNPPEPPTGVAEAAAEVPAPAADSVTRAEFDALAQLVHEQVGALGDIARRISEGGMDQYVLNLRSAMAVPQFRDELANAVHDVIRQRGTLRVENRSGIEHRLLINGSEHRIPALRIVEIDVPVGTLTTELVGYEAPKNWTVGPPNYQQAITITPRPTPAVYVEAPVMVDSPAFIGPPVILY